MFRMGEVNKRWEQICESRRKFLAGEVNMDDVFDSNLDRLMRNYMAAEVGMAERGVTPNRVQESENAARAVQEYFHDTVMAEREACAKIADWRACEQRRLARESNGQGRYHIWADSVAHASEAEQIARYIRKRV